MTGWAWGAYVVFRTIASIIVLRLTLAAAVARWGMPAYTGPGSPQTPVRMPSREEVNHMTDEIRETPAEAEEPQAEEAQPEAADLGDDPDGDSTPEAE